MARRTRWDHSLGRGRASAEDQHSSGENIADADAAAPWYDDHTDVWFDDRGVLVAGDRQPPTGRGPSGRAECFVPPPCISRPDLMRLLAAACGAVVVVLLLVLAAGFPRARHVGRLFDRRSPRKIDGVCFILRFLVKRILRWSLLPRKTHTAPTSTDGVCFICAAVDLGGGDRLGAVPRPWHQQVRGHFRQLGEVAIERLHGRGRGIRCIPDRLGVGIDGPTVVRPPTNDGAGGGEVRR